jgi:hypothetical protein
MSWLSAVPPRGSRKRRIDIPFGLWPSSFTAVGSIVIAGRHKFSMADFDKVESVVFECVGYVDAGSAQIYVYNVTDGVNISGSELNFVSGGVSVVLTSSDIKNMLPTTEKALDVRISALASGRTFYYKGGRLKIIQRE